ncbi:MAG: 1-(5-phosphoribosyl)-5-[(5-phosphoribosylamino)methylideneamino]imidazole-4-carboxamide isomerase [Cyclobacteriaceae bacterium]|nr:1-(5-phosphoribosyl)-5-[(5-phosphoribosylamino)methylideneamino]imidazole-4-carboxamide isomerase [Cyclobacteriaceae bacterium HetDA_MAG_MS6]
MHIIPAIDIIDGQCVRLEKGDYNAKKVYQTDPVAVARQFEEAGIQRLHLVDLDGAKAKTVVNLKVLEAITSDTDLHVDFGGGVKKMEDLDSVLSAGAKQVTGGSIAAKDRPQFLSWIKRHGNERIILGADALDRKIMVSGWQESTSLDLFEFLRFYLNNSIQYVICTDISKDGMMQGPAFDLYTEILKEFPGIKLIASGGVTTVNDLQKLRNLGLYGAIVGKAIYEGSIALKDIERFHHAN